MGGPWRGRAVVPRHGLARARRQRPGHAGACRHLPAGDRHRPGAGHPGHRPRVRPAGGGRPDRHAGRWRPAGPGPAGGARELGDRGRARSACGGGLPAAGIPVGLSVDTTALTGNADMFAIMKLAQGLANAAAEDEFALTARRTLALATIDGARSLGLAEVTGSLSPGKRADLIVVSATGPNLGMVTDPVQLLVTAAQPGNVDTVIADGQVLKRGGE